ncbi:hypothetical protein GGR57DRAFT_323113 [Xylariaceae sp. FL1272]|nr:hypothetical protein GGR57DRAFT_323113 [Xylariaceae sp. FL1272]
METTDLNDFTCTLGQAASLRRQQDEPITSFQTVLELIDEQAKRLPGSPALGFANFTKPKRSAESQSDSVTFLELRDLSITAAIRLADILEIPEDGQTSRTIGLLCTSSLDFILTWLGLMRLGFRGLLLAPQLEAQAIQHLCTTSDVDTILVGENQEQKTSQLQGSIKIVKIPTGPLATNWKSGAHENKQLSNQPPDIAYLMHTSGTSSGLPKPIPQSQWGAVGCLPVLDDKDEPATFSTTPLYHGGLADCFRAWTSGAMIWFFPEGAAPITGANVLNAVNFARGQSPTPVQFFSSVPYVLQMLAESEEGVRLLQTMDLVGVGGAPLPPLVGDRLVYLNVNLVSRMGSAECGFLMSSHREYSHDKEWQYLRPLDDPELLSFEPREGGLSELVVKPGWPLRLKVNRDDGSYATSDLFEPHPTIPNAWRYHSRADAQITLVNGKKFDPSPLEGAIKASSTLLEDVLIFGAGRDYAGALLFTTSSASSNEDVLEAVWPSIKELNRESQSHARLTKAMLVVIQATEGETSLPKSSKGTILRRQAEEQYVKEIDAAYSCKGTGSSGNRQISDDEVLPLVCDICSQVLGRDVNPEKDLYQQGVDSIACIQIRKLLESSMLPAGYPPLRMNIVYDNGTINALVSELIDIRHGVTNGPGDDNDELRLMQELSDKYSRSQWNAKRNGKKDGIVVVLTGATGMLGAHLLSQLSSNAKVRRIYCLLRGQTPFAVRERVSKALLGRQLPLPEEGLDGDNSKIVCLSCDLTDHRLGLSQDDWTRVTEDSTIVIHAAWAVNFSLRLGSFENHIAGTKNLINLAVSSGAAFFFIGSTAAVSGKGIGAVSEKGSLDPAEASPLGYSRSKWVAERVCQAAHDHLLQHALASANKAPISIVRVGQLCGNEAGVWNMSEAYPLMLSSAKVTGCLPALPNESLDWLPVDVAARAVLEIAMPWEQTAGVSDANGVSTPEMPVFHVLNPHRTPTWQDMLDWISKEPGVSVEAIPPAEWIRRLESALEPSEAKHPSQALLGLWKRTYGNSDTTQASEADGNGNSNRSPTFEVTSTGRMSQTMRDVQPLDRTRVMRMWKWIQENTGE